MHKLGFLAVTAAAFIATPALADDSAVAGSWAIEARSDFGTFRSDWTVSEQDGVWTLELVDAPMEGGPGGDGPPPQSRISEIRVEGNTLTFNRELMMGDMAINLSYNVTADGDAMTGQTVSDFGNIPIVGTRK